MKEKPWFTFQEGKEELLRRRERAYDLSKSLSTKRKTTRQFPLVHESQQGTIAPDDGNREVKNFMKIREKNGNLYTEGLFIDRLLFLHHSP